MKYKTNKWIRTLVKHWIRQCHVHENLENIPIDHINHILYQHNVFFNNFSLIKGTWDRRKRNIRLEYDERIAKANPGAEPRIGWYEKYFNKINSYKQFHFSFLLNHLDCCPTMDILEDVHMIQLACSVPDTPENRTIPILDAHHLWECKRTREYNPKHALDFDRTPFQQKRPQIVWRGNSCPTFEGKNQQIFFLRNEVCQTYRNDPLYNVGFANAPQSPWNKEFMTYREMTQYKYILNIDGYGASFDGTIWKLRSPSLVIWITDKKHKMHWVQWYTPLLKPYVHYIPSSVEDLSKTWEWCEKHPDKCKQIADNATLLIEKVLANTDRYHYTLFEEIDKIINRDRTASLDPERNSDTTDDIMSKETQPQPQPHISDLD